MPFTLQFGKVLIFSETWSKSAPGQIVSRIRFSHSRKCSIGVLSSPDVSFLFPLLTAPSEHPVYKLSIRSNAMHCRYNSHLIFFQEHLMRAELACK
ncbi:hypothetical protein L6452_32126 [Arctium lappa]|uniref:Uncharacterized protein n=1 Tax=Arctium lappa TaxID=4217 RepID=A0ACB8Z3G1_ARCLA|nr:hypothetical protein L6452_32126 [Arctium lappa]